MPVFFRKFGHEKNCIYPKFHCMKKFAYLFAALFLAAFTIFSSCKKDENTPDQQFTFNLKAGPGYVSGDVTLTTGEQFKVGINAFASTGSTLIRFLVTRVYNDKPDVVFDTTLNLTVLNYDFFGIALGGPGTEKWIFTITQSDESTLEKSFNITTESAVGPIFTYDQCIIGAQQNSTGSSFASSNGTIYNLAEAKNNAAMIDWLYYFGVTTFATLAAPDNDDAAHIFTDGGSYTNPGPNALLNWAVRNATRFRTIKDPLDWDAIQDDTELIVLSQGAIEPNAPDLLSGYYVAFVTANGKKGLIRINSINLEEDGTIDISVKVQQ